MSTFLADVFASSWEVSENQRARCSRSGHLNLVESAPFQISRSFRTTLVGLSFCLVPTLSNVSTAQQLLASHFQSRPKTTSKQKLKPKPQASIAPL